MELEQAATALGVCDQLTEWPELGVLSTLRAVAPKPKPLARIAPERLSCGGEAIKRDGVCFQIVELFLASQYAVMSPCVDFNSC
jgi:hypothetical protein